jgi:enamine deaminase RidA (YjgF/YER057c/UK114 family)
MASIQRIRRLGLVPSPAFSHTAIVPPGATTIDVVGRNAVDADGSLVGRGDVAVQSARALENAKTALAAAGAAARRDQRECGGAAVKLRPSPECQAL